MQIKTTSKILTLLSKEYVRIVFIEKGNERFVERNGITELHLIAGKLEKITPRTFRTLVREIVMSAKKHKIAKIALTINFENVPKLHEFGAEWMWQTLGENIHLAHYEFTRYKSNPQKVVLEEILITDITDKKIPAYITYGETIALFANHTRDIANTPGGDMTPALLGESAKRVLKGTKATVKVLDDTAITKLKMGGLLGVGQGALHKPRFIVIEYNGTKNAKNKKRPIVYVGKGITFDTGGLQVKPGMSMYEMHMDMSGGAAVIGAIGAIAKLGLPQHVIGLIPAAENAVSDRAMRPGDVLTMMSGTTVDILHTDAEGRLVLADALHYAKQYKPR